MQTATSLRYFTLHIQYSEAITFHSNVALRFVIFSSHRFANLQRSVSKWPSSVRFYLKKQKRLIRGNERVIRQTSRHRRKRSRMRQSSITQTPLMFWDRLVWPLNNSSLKTNPTSTWFRKRVMSSPLRARLLPRPRLSGKE